MEALKSSSKLIEIYKSIILTLILIVLIGIYLKTPIPFTRNTLKELKTIQDEDIRRKKILDIPVVWIKNEPLDVNVQNSSLDVDVQNWP